MAKIGKMRRQFVKKRFQDMATDDLVSDREKNAYEQQSLDAAKQMQAAQNLGNQRVAQATTGGNPLVSGSITQSVADMGRAGWEAATKAASDSNKLAASLKDSRESQTLAAGERLIASNKEDAAMAVDSVLKVAEVGAQIATLGMGA
jgi:hypothetical protein